MNINDLYKQVILDHARNRRNHRKMDSYTHKVHYKNPTCGDIMTMYATIKADKIEDLSFVGEGCFISMASSSMFTNIAKRKTIDEIQELSPVMKNMVLSGKIVDDLRLEDAISLRDIHKFPARYNCALMPWQAFEKLLKTRGK
jgi:nitrogen fixation protein NifU and related proteins